MKILAIGFEDVNELAPHYKFGQRIPSCDIVKTKFFFFQVVVIPLVYFVWDEHSVDTILSNKKFCHVVSILLFCHSVPKSGFKVNLS